MDAAAQPAQDDPAGRELDHAARRSPGYLETLKRFRAVDRGHGCYMPLDRLRKGRGPLDPTFSRSQFRRYVSRARTLGDLVFAGFAAKGNAVYLQPDRAYKREDLPIDPSRTARHMLREDLGERYNAGWDPGRAAPLIGGRIEWEAQDQLIDGYSVPRSIVRDYSIDVIKKAIAQIYAWNGKDLSRLQSKSGVLRHWCRLIAAAQRVERVAQKPPEQRTPKEARAAQLTDKELDALRELEEQAKDNPIAQALLAMAQKDAREKLQARGAAAPFPEAAPSAPAAPVGLYAACDAFLAEACAELAEETRARYYPVKLQQLRRLLGDRPLEPLGAKDLDAYVQARRQEVQIPTIRQELNALALVYDHARRKAWCAVDVRPLCPRLRDRRPMPQPTMVTREQFDRICEKLDESRREFLEIVAYLMCRPSEATGLQLDHVHRDGDAWEIEVRGTKHRYAHARLPLVGRPRAIVEARHARGLTTGPLVLPWTNVRRDLPAACEAAGVPRVTLTDLRASASTWLLDEGVPKHLVVRLGRWRDETMLDRRYYRRSTPALRGAAEALSRPPPH